MARDYGWQMTVEALETPPGSEAAAGSLLFWFGAGISRASGMPDGAGLTRHWLAHHLPPEELAPLLAVFAVSERWTGKSLPRLEKVIEDTLWVAGEDCLANLEIFRHCPPNWVHRQIAAVLWQQGGWAVTTNFDEAVETAVQETGGTLAVLTPQDHTPPTPGSGGLLKLHGSIHQPWEGLGHSIRNLERGLAPPLRERLLSLLDDPQQTVVFLGYSGSDFFDITPLFEERLQREDPFQARAIWLCWQPEPVKEGAADEAALLELLEEGACTMFMAFDPARRRLLIGPTEVTLPAVVGELAAATLLLPSSVAAPLPPSRRWDQDWSARFDPSPAQRRLFAARLYASLGMGRAALHHTAPAALQAGRVADTESRLALNALRDLGWYEAEYHCRQQLLAPPELLAQQAWQRQQLACLRLSGRLLRAAWGYGHLLAAPRQSPASLSSPPATEQVEQFGGWVDAGIFFHSLCTGLLQWPAARYWLFLPVMLLRLLVAWALWRLDADNNAPEVSDPHQRELITRLSNFLCDPMGPLVDLAENIYFRCRPVLDLHDGRGNGFRETDSLLGMVNHERNTATAYLNQLDWGWLGPLSNAHNLELWGHMTQGLQTSYGLARVIDDRPGQIKAARLLAKLASWQQQDRRAAVWRRRAVRCRAELQRQQREFLANRRYFAGKLEHAQASRNPK